ncbi:right-handed parallel beta-helix repeat-containing protein [Thalassoglobus polymorphus]|uniref:Right handed beta helix domain-containing protein n=1 Tax=Thalassoglobus polymorphus TaxID=2527994 RepID=A0A517QJW1_9PLAN|nr:right-handed parallel beta-helix repeat-containing protein [Thalassoglobus polymorphus]QDT31895.1 hypothetical protein Mal48_11320 [Thalassoglobus polymorphus]
MKDTCKSWLQVITACLGLSATTWGQSPDVGAFEAQQSEGGAVSQADYGSVRLGGQDHSASAAVPAPGVQQTHFIPGAPPMFNDALVPQDESVGFAATRPRDEILWRVGRSSMDRYGFEDGYTNLNAFIPLAFESDRALWWVNPRVNISDGGDGSASFGLGYREYIPEDDRVYGASFWWDNETAYNGDYNQLGGSFESLGRYVDMRMNFSIPIGESMNTSVVGQGENAFVGNNISVQQFIRTEEALQTYDAEIATPFPYLGGYGVDVGVGFYILAGEETDTSAGVSVRTQAQINDSFWLNGLYTNDPEFGSNFSINFELTMPSSGPIRWFKRPAVASALTDSVIRRYRMPVSTGTGIQQNIAINPKTGLPYNVAHIDPDDLTSGNGSVGNPFMSLEEYSALSLAEQGAFDIIYVQPREDETDTNLNTGLGLLSGQRLLSSSVQHYFESEGSLFVMPGFVADQPLPLLTSSGIVGNDHIITLETGGNCFEVAGFQIDHQMTLTGPNASTGSAIYGDMVSSVSINRNILENSEYATQLTNFSGSLHYSENVLRDNIIGGLQAEFTGDGALALFSNSTSNNMGIGFEVIADGANIMADNLPDAVPTAPDADLPVFSDGSVYIDPSDLTDATNVFPFDPATMSTGIVGNSADLNETGMQIEAINGGTINASVEDNTFSNNQDITSAGFVANAEGVGSEITLTTFQRNTFENNIGSGALLASRDGGTINTPLQVDPLDPLEFIPGFTGNLFDSNSRNGLTVIVDNSEMNDFVMGANTFSNNGESGFAAYLNDATFNDWEFDMNLFDRNGRDGMAFVMDNATNNQFYITNNDITDNAGNGINIIGVDSLMDDLIITNNFIQGNGSPIGGFNINVAFLGGLTPAQQAQFNFAAQRWQEIIIGDLPDVVDPVYGLIDDITITAEGADLGPGILGQAGFTAQRNDADMLPYLGLMEFSNSFLPTLPALELRDVIIHEMGHVLGFTDFLWAQKGLVDYPNALYTGANAVAEHNALFNLNDTGVPLQTGIGPGSDYAHWDDALYGDELMTYSATGTAPRKISRVTAAMFSDLGYTVDMSAADQTFPLVPGTAGGSELEMVAPSAATIAANEQKLANYMLAASTLPLDDPGVVTQAGVGGNSGIQFDLTDSTVNVTMQDNLIDQNLASNLRGELHGASALNLNSSRDQYTASSSGSGLNIITRDTSAANIDLMNATITGNADNGYRGETFNGSTMSVSITSPVDPEFTGLTTISNNTNHGISIISSPDSPTVNTSLVDLFVEETLISGNGQRGVNILSSEFSIFDEIRIQDSVITSNGSDGIGMNRKDDGFINGTILRNTIESNTGDGISLLSQNANTTDTYLIQDNIIRNNTRGIHMRVEADAVLDSIINSNLIDANSSHGIHVTDRANSALDQRNVTGIWTQNEIVNNGGSGIQLDGSYGIDSLLEIGQNGVDGDGFSLGNIIQGNEAAGIQSTAVGIADIHNNLITDNGASGIDIQSTVFFGNIIGIDNNFIADNADIGIEIRADNNVIVESEITNNTITGNGSDGIEVATLNLASSDITVDSNIIFDNRGRGVDILNAGFSPDMVFNLLNNTINVNDGEGVYVVNTSDEAQYNFKDAPTPDNNPLNDETHGMQANGSIFADPRMLFNMDNNIVNNNGIGSQFDATGFVMRVGTSDGGFGTTFEGGYASDGFGGVVANITDNVFSGNFGTDVWFESFRSTANPPVTNGTWTQNEFSLDAPYRSDPLARLDLVFTGNTGNSIDVTNTGAWYDNAEPVFKSRLNNIAAPNIAGPFRISTRRRNAQRLASRDGLPPFVGPGLTYLYPGMGTSTFRVSAASIIGFTGDGTSNEFDTIGSTFNSAAPINTGFEFGELFFDWDTTTYVP